MANITKERLADYLIWSSEHGMWWRSDSAGYTYSLSSAGRYTRDRALQICAFARDGWGKHAPNEIPVAETDALECDRLYKSRLPAIAREHNEMLERDNG